MSRPALVYRRASSPAPSPGVVRVAVGLPQAGGAAGPGPEAATLTKSHNSPPFRCETYRGASLIRLKVPAAHTLPPPQGLRSEVSEFSAKSRRRLLLFMATIERACLPFMLTLTYPEAFEADPVLYKAHLDAWFKRAARRWPQMAAIWKLEFQQRGAPHFHLFLWGLQVDTHLQGIKLCPENLRAAPCYSQFAEWAARTWYEVVASGDSKHLRHGTKFESIRSPQGIMRYVAGYMSKSDQTLPGQKVGRYWGAHNRRGIPTVEPESTPLEPQDFQALRRAARRFERAGRMVAFHNARKAGRKPPKPRQRNNSSVALLCDAEQWWKRFPAIIENRRWWLQNRACNSHAKAPA